MIGGEVDGLEELNAPKVLADARHAGGNVVCKAREDPGAEEARAPSLCGGLDSRAGSFARRAHVSEIARYNVDPAFEKATEHVYARELMRRVADAIGAEGKQGVDVVRGLDPEPADPA